MNHQHTMIDREIHEILERKSQLDDDFESSPQSIVISHVFRSFFVYFAYFAVLLNGCGPRSAPVVDPLPVPPAPEVVFTDVTAQAGIHFQHINGAVGAKWLPETM